MNDGRQTNGRENGLLRHAFASQNLLVRIDAESAAIDRRNSRAPQFKVDGINTGVAEELGLSEHTIKKYLLRIFDKVGTSSRVELVLYAMSHGENRPAEWMPTNA